MANPGIIIEIGARTQDAIRGINGVNKALGSKLSGAEKFKAGVNKAFLPAVAAMTGLAAAGFSAVKSAERAATANAKLGNVFEQMGIADATDRVKEYAKELGATIAVEDETVKAVQTKLGTFKELAASADEAGGAFDRATQAAFDLAAAGFGEAESNAVQLGKALNDPIKGLTALTRSGVTFTEAEQERIKAMVEAGNVGEAQAEILKAIETQVGGTAEASADSSDKMAIAFKEVQESIGTLLLPAFEKLSGWAQTLARYMQENAQVFVVVGAAVAVLAGAVIAAKVAIVTYNAVMTIWGAITKAVAAAQWLLNAALSANPIGIVIIAIVALIAAIVLLWNNSETFRNIVMAVWEAVQKAISAVVDWFVDNVVPWIKRAVEFIVGYYQFLWSIVKTVFNAVRTIIKTVVDWFRKNVVRWIEAAVNLIVGYYEFLWKIVETAWNGIRTVIDAVASWFRDTIAPIIGNVVNAIRGFFTGLRDQVKSIWEKIKEYILAPVKYFQNNIKPKIDEFVGGVRRAFEGLRDAIYAIFERIKSIVASAWDFVMGKINAIKNGLSNIPIVGGVFGRSATAGPPITYATRADGVLRSAPAMTIRTTNDTPNTVINVNGALDPVAVAKQIRRILNDQNARLGSVA